MPTYTFELNGEPTRVEAPADLPLLWVLRDKLGVTGPKYGCGVGLCRACTSHLDGEEIAACSVPVSDVEGRRVTTIEGLANGDMLHPVQEAWLEQDVAQCGFCQPGQIMAAAALLERHPGVRGGQEPSDEDIDELQNMCRCGTYMRIRAAIKSAAAKMSERANGAPTTAAAATGVRSSGEESSDDVTTASDGGTAQGGGANEAPLPATGSGLGVAAIGAAIAAAKRAGGQE